MSEHEPLEQPAPQDAPEPSAPPTMMKQAAIMAVTFGQAKWVLFAQYFILVMVGLMIIVDLILVFNKATGDTFSNVLRDWSYRWFFVITWIWGVAGGHLFLSNPDPIFPQTISIPILLALTAVLLIGGLYFKGIVNIWVQVVLLVLGIIAGYVLWPQSPTTP